MELAEPAASYSRCYSMRRTASLSGIATGAMPLETLLELAATSAFHRPSGAGLKVEPSKVALAVGAAQSFKVANEFATKVKWTTSNAAVLFRHGPGDSRRSWPR